MAWNDLTREQMETQLIRQAQVIGVWRSALEKVVEARMPGQARSIAREALRAYQQQPPQAWVEAKKEVDDGWLDK
jgi:hypothetical protein